MTDAPPPIDDELVSAVLDGEATPDERARVDADPAARQRRRELAAARDLVATPVAVPAEVRERAIAAALAAAGDPATGSPGPPPVPDEPTDELATRRSRRRALPALAAAAAVLVVLVGVVGALVRPDRGAEMTASQAPTEVLDQTASTTVLESQAPEDAGSAGPSTTAPPMPTTTARSGSAGAPSTVAPSTATADAPVEDLGALASTAELRDATLALLERSAGQPAAPPDLAGGGGCVATAGAGDPEVAELLVVADATLEGRPVQVAAFAIDLVRTPAANGSLRIYALDPTTCAPVAVLTVG